MVVVDCEAVDCEAVGCEAIDCEAVGTLLFSLLPPVFRGGRVTVLEP